MIKNILKKGYIVDIEEDDLKDAKLSSTDFDGNETKQRAFINVLGARLAMKLLFTNKIQASNVYSLYTIHNVLEELDIADIYLDNIKIDVRLVFNKDEIFIPKTHFEYGIEPDLYLVLELKDDLSSVELLGFCEPENLNKSNQNDKFYFFEYEKLELPKKLKPFLTKLSSKTNLVISEANTEKAEQLLLSLIDKEISKQDKLFLFKQLASNIALREQIVEFENFDIMAKETAKDNEILNDKVLDIVGTQQLFENEDFSDENAEFMQELLSNKDEIENDLSIDESPTWNLDDLIDNASLEAEDTQIQPEDSQSEELSEQSDKDNNSSNIATTIAANGVISTIGGAIGGAVAGAAIASGIAAVSTEANILENSIETVSAGIDLGNKVLDTAEKLLQKSRDEIIAESPDFDLIEELINEDSETAIENIESLHEETLPEEVLHEKMQYEEVLHEEMLHALPELQELEAFAPLETVEETFKFEDIASNNDFMAAEQIEVSEVSEESSEKVYSLDNFDFNMINEKIDDIEEEEKVPDYLSSLMNESEIETDLSSDEVQTEAMPEYFTNLETVEEIPTEEVHAEESVVDEISVEATVKDEEESTNDEITQENFSELDKTAQILEEFDAFESLEEKVEQENSSTEMSEENITPSEDDTDDIIAQIDDFLKDVEYSDEKKELLSSILLEEQPEEEIENTVEDIQPIQNLPEEPEAQEAVTIENDNNKSLENELDLLTQRFKEEKIDDIEETVADSGRKLEIPEILLKNKKMVIAASLAGVIFAAYAIGTSISNKNIEDSLLKAPPVSTESQAPANDLQTNPNGETEYDANSSMMQQGQTADNLQNPQNPQDTQNLQNQDMGQAVSNAFSSEPINATITKVAWEVPEDLAYNDSFRKYLQMAGKNLKLNLQNDLLSTNEMAYSSKVVVDLAINRDGSPQSANIAVSSGSKAIDRIVLQSVKNTLKYLKMPADELTGNSINATLIINF